MGATSEAAETVLEAAIALRSGLLSGLLSGDHQVPESYDALLEAS
jgi:hypothetical protein